MFLSFGATSFIHLLAIEIFPDDIVSRPAIQFSNVDFPQPEGPTNTRKSPLSILKFILFNTPKAPNFFSRFSTFKISVIIYPLTEPEVKPLIKYLPAKM